MNVRLCLIKASLAVVALTVVACSSTSEPSAREENTLAEQLPMEGEQTCGAARDWAEANAGRLPTNYDAFGRYSMVYRRAIFSAATPEEKAKLWKEHVERYLADHQHELTAQQRSVLERTLTLVASSSDPWAESGVSLPRALELEALKAFGRDGVRDVLATLGSTNQVRSTSSESLERDCECIAASDYCSSPLKCKFRAHTACRWKSIGCGFLWQYPCNGNCE